MKTFVALVIEPKNTFQSICDYDYSNSNFMIIDMIIYTCLLR